MAGEASGLEDLLHEDVGGVPAWGIGVAGAAAIIGIIWWRNRKSSSSSSADQQASGTSVDATSGGSAGDPYPPDGSTDDPSDPNSTDSSTGMTYGDESYGSGNGYAGGIDAYLQGNPTNPAYPVGLSPQGLPGPVTNTQWSRLVADYLISKGDDPTLVNNALNNFVNGKALTQAEQAVINLGLTTFGEPPQGVPSITTGGTGGGTGGGTPPVVNPGGPNHPKTRIFVVPRDEYLNKLSVSEHWDHATELQIRQLNGFGKTAHLRKGQRIKIPA